MSTRLPFSQRKQEKKGFRPDLEGLRAVAVLLVVLYHAGVQTLGGGYVGVDVFYVLSGFFITGQLWKSLSTTGTIRFREFYARRARRLLPTAALVLLVTAAASYFLLPPLMLHETGWDIIASAWNVSNIRFAALATDYLTASANPSPVLHYWSLAVEEQFYFVWPLLVFLAGRVWLKKRRASRSIPANKTRTVVVLAVVAVVSLLASIYITRVNQPIAFFNLPTRAWELAIGGLLALGANRFHKIPESLRSGFGWVGLLTIFAVSVLYTAKTPFPGWTAVLPVLGAGAVILASEAGPAKMLSIAPMRAIGRWSFSFYLWHWPFLIFADAVGGGFIPVRIKLFLMFVALVLSGVTYKFFENPIRRSPWLGKTSFRGLAMALIATLTVSAAGYGLMASKLSNEHSGTLTIPVSVTAIEQAVEAGLLKRPVPSNLTPTLSSAKDLSTSATYGSGCMAAYNETQFPSCEFGNTASSFSIWLVGDSHANHWFGAVEAVAKKYNVKLVIHARSGCPLLDTPLTNPNVTTATYENCTTWTRQVIDAARTAHPDLLLVTGTEMITAFHMNSYLRQLEKLQSLAKNMLVLGDTPHSDHDLAVCVSAHLDDASYCNINSQDLGGKANYTLLHRQLADMITGAGMYYVDPTEWVCAQNGMCPVIVDNVLLYRDESHLSLAGSKWLAPAMEQALQRFLPVTAQQASTTLLNQSEELVKDR